jgi:hypothetical protein
MATLGSFLEFSPFQRVGENSRVTPTVILYDRWYYIKASFYPQSHSRLESMASSNSNAVNPVRCCLHI